MSNIDKNIDIALQYAEKIIGTKYKYWYEGTELSNRGPMWVWETPVPTVDFILTESVNCTGLINLMRRAVNLSIPGLNLNVKYPGGIYAWCQYLKLKNVLHNFSVNLSYPRGTLFLREYTSETDQGHAAVLYTENIECSLYSIIIHSCTNRSFRINTKLDPGVNIDNTLGQSHFYYKFGYYQYYCLPENWLI